MSDAIEFKTPERCLLIQAVLWVSRGLRPISDDIFLAAPYKLNEQDTEGAIPLIRCLREGRLETRGNLFLVDDFQPYESSFLREFTPPSEVFSIASVNLDHSVVDLTPFAEFPDAGYRHVQFRKVKAPVPAELDMVVVLRDVTVPTETLFELFPEPTAGRDGDRREILQPSRDPTPLMSGAPGRPTSMHLVLAEYGRRCETGEAERGTNEEARILSEWLGKTHPGSPQLKPKTIANKIRGSQRAQREKPQN